MLAGFAWTRLAILGGLVFFSGIVDSLAGGGGLITLPAYLAAGLNPIFLLGTNKLSSSMGTTVSAARYGRHHRIRLKSMAPIVLVSLTGSWIGARLGQHLGPQVLRYLLLVAIPAVGFAVFSKHDFGGADASAGLGSSRLRARAIAVAFPLGAYDGFFGPGTGTFLALGFTQFCRLDLPQATAWSKLLNLASNVSALASFLWVGRADVPLGLAMGCLSISGNYVGSHIGIRRGSAAIRPMILFVCAGLFAKLLLDVLRAS